MSAAPEVKTYHPKALQEPTWVSLQTVQRNSLLDVLAKNGLSEEQVNDFVGFGDPDRYHRSHLDPNSEVGHRFAPNQSFRGLRVAVAWEENVPVGFGYSAVNVSGSKIQRGIKRVMSSIGAGNKEYLWLREIAVDPAHQRSGIGRAILRILLEDACQSNNSSKPVTAYFWPDHTAFLSGVFDNLGFKPGGDQDIQPFGPGGLRVTQRRMVAPNAQSVLNIMAASSKG